MAPLLFMLVCDLCTQFDKLLSSLLLLPDSLVAGDDCQLLSLPSHHHMPHHRSLGSLTTDQHLQGMNN